MSELSDKLAYTEQPQYGYITNEPGVVDETWMLGLPFLGGLANKGLKNIGGYLPYINDIWQGRDLLFHKPFDQMTKNEFRQYGNLGEKYYQEHLQNNPVEIKNYGEIRFGAKNKGKDKTRNYEQYPFLRKNLENANKENFSTNYKNEADREYDYFSNIYNGDLFHYLIENIKDVGKRYKMMKNKSKGE